MTNELAPTKTAPLQMLFDGECIVCSTEVSHYKRTVPQANIKYVDITTAQINYPELGLDRDEVNRVLHVIKPDGSSAKAMQAFIAIWDELGKYKSRYRYLSQAAQAPGLKLAFNAGYLLFAEQIRPRLPKRKA